MTELFSCLHKTYVYFSYCAPFLGIKRAVPVKDSRFSFLVNGYWVGSLV